MDSIEQWHTIADERSAELVRLRAELERTLNERDVAHQVIEVARDHISQLNDAIRGAARLLRESGTVRRDTPEHIELVDGWIRHPVVVLACTSVWATRRAEPPVEP